MRMICMFLVGLSCAQGLEESKALSGTRFMENGGKGSFSSGAPVVPVGQGKRAPALSPAQPKDPARVEVPVPGNDGQEEAWKRVRQLTTGMGIGAGLGIGAGVYAGAKTGGLAGAAMGGLAGALVGSIVGGLVALIIVSRR